MRLVLLTASGEGGHRFDPGLGVPLTDSTLTGKIIPFFAPVSQTRLAAMGQPTHASERPSRVLTTGSSAASHKAFSKVRQAMPGSQSAGHFDGDLPDFACNAQCSPPVVSSQPRRSLKELSSEGCENGGFLRSCAAPKMELGEVCGARRWE